MKEIFFGRRVGVGLDIIGSFAFYGISRLTFSTGKGRYVLVAVLGLDRVSLPLLAPYKLAGTQMQLMEVVWLWRVKSAPFYYSQLQ